jgi:hypothetical protein
MFAQKRPQLVLESHRPVMLLLKGDVFFSQPRWGCDVGRRFTQGSSSLATLGFGAKSLWDFFEEMSKLQSASGTLAAR